MKTKLLAAALMLVLLIFIESKYIRTVAIISADGIEDFLLYTSRDFF